MDALSSGNTLTLFIHFFFNYKDIREYVMDPNLTNIYKLYLHILIINEMKIFTHTNFPFLYTRLKQALFVLLWGSYIGNPTPFYNKIHTFLSSAITRWHDCDPSGCNLCVTVIIPASVMALQASEKSEQVWTVVQMETIFTIHCL